MMSGSIFSKVMGMAILAGALSACSVAPAYRAPVMDVPEQYREATLLAHAESGGSWKIAEPADHHEEPVGWEMLQDDDLLALQARAVAANQELAAAVARLDAARALVGQARAAWLPEIGIGTGVSRQRLASAGQGGSDADAAMLRTSWRAQAAVAYEVDVFGRVSASVQSAQADADGQRAQASALKLIIQADVAHHYLLLRQLDAEAAILDESVLAWTQTLELVQSKRDQGVVTEAVVASIETQLTQVQAQRIATGQQRSLAEHALAVLLGEFPSRFSLPVRPQSFVALSIPPGLPSSLLERRPDIAAAERAMAAENARIGIAKAAFFPSLSLTGAFGYESASLGSLFDWSQRTFLLGPLVGTALNLTAFDGGRRRAALAQAEAAYQERLAQYRQVVLRAFREVEDGLASVRDLDARLERLRAAQAGAARARAEARDRFDAGDVDYLFVLETERAWLTQQQAVARAEGDRLRAAVDLVRALGGGWGRRTAGAQDVAA
jgi:efflux transporter, outer membrane factor (OMF) lipoprotein, NodT family